MDGHSGIENKKVNESSSGNFRLVLSYLKDSSGQGSFVLHATSNVSYSYGLQPPEFLQSIGLQHFPGACQFHHDRCFWRCIATLPGVDRGFEHMNDVQAVHRAFNEFAGKIGDLYSLQQQQDRILREMRFEPRGLQIFGPPAEIVLAESEVPGWVQSIKFPALNELEAGAQKLQTEIDSLSAHLPLVFTTGEQLVDAVLVSLRLLGLKANRTEPGFTADVLAETADGKRRFGFEVTGTNGPIRKESKKLTQLLEFERVKEHGEKTILIANTYHRTPVDERADKEHFTRPVVDFLGHHPILLMTGWDLYRMVGSVLGGTKSKEDVVKTLHKSNGVLSLK
jgi:hypothetical protein